MKRVAPTKMLFVSFANQHSTAVRKISQLRKSGANLKVYDAKIDKNKSSILYRLLSGAYVKLLIGLIFDKQKIWWLWGVDVCLVGSVAALFRPNKTVIWDISDIQVIFLGTRLHSKVLRILERILLRRSDRLILSSSGFWKYHYEGYIPADRVSIIENLLDGQPIPCVRETPSDTVNIIYSGILRSERILAIIIDCAILCKGAAKFHLWGVFDPKIGVETIDRITACHHIVFHGGYAEDDLPLIYRGMHLTLGLVDVDADNNEKWLLSNRLYQAGAFKCPIVATNGSNVGSETINRRLGWVVDNNSLELATLVLGLTGEGNLKYTRVLWQMPDQREFYFCDEYAKLCAELS
jgi:glycosyltransferase involved in cell wall biosynthesis